jgi:hypothetical protein
MPETLTIAFIEWDPKTQVAGMIHFPGINDEVYEEFVKTHDILRYEEIGEDKVFVKSIG